MARSREPRRGPGRVSTTPDRPPARERYDVAVVGAGVLGAACAALLRRWAPQLSLVVIEADGIPNEAGASVASPGLIPPLPAEGEPEAERADELRLARALAAEALPGRPETRARWLRPLPQDPPPPPEARPLGELVTAPLAAALDRVAGLDPDRPALLSDGGYLPPDALALALARRAVAGGADLMLNTRVRPAGGGEGAWRLRLERLALDRRMALGVRARHTVSAAAVVVACGAAGAEVAEAALDRPVSLPVAYRQFPRLRLPPLPPDGARPVVDLAGWRIRPAGAGGLLVPPPLPPDPVGFRPVPGRLMGVTVGLRRELIERLLAEPELEALLASGALELGKSVRSVRGAWVSASPQPAARALGAGWWLLAGSERGLDRDLAAAARVAAAVARERAGADAPWPLGTG